MVWTACTSNKELEDISPAQWDKLCTLDEYPSDSFMFSAFGYDLHAAMADGEIGGLVGMSRSAVQRHRTKTLNELRQRLEDNGGRNAK